MALQKTHTNDQGVDGNYWRIDEAKLNRHEFKACNVTLSLYKDSTAASNNDAPLHVESYSWNTEAPDEYTGSFDAATLDTLNYNLHERVYEKLKTLTTPIDFTTGTTDV